MLWPVVLCDLITQNLSITAACIPHLKPFIQSLESGMIRTDDLRRLGLSSAYGYGSGKAKSYQLSSLSSRITRSGLSSRFTRSATAERGSPSQVKPKIRSSSVEGPISFPGQHSTTLTTASAGTGAAQSWDMQSQKSTSGMIQQTRTWSVE